VRSISPILEQMAWLALLKLVRPAEAYVRQKQDRSRLRAKRGTGWAKAPGWAAFGPFGSKPPPGRVRPSRSFPEGVQKGPTQWEDRARELEAANRQAVEEGAEELLRSGAALISTPSGPVQAKLVRFWTGTGILDCRFPSTKDRNGRSFTLVDRRQLKGNSPSSLTGHLFSSIISLDHDAHPDLWGPPPPEPKRVSSPGGWAPPSGVRPGWNWVPPGGAVPRVDLMPRWVRLWYRTPFIDRFAHAWMWKRGGWEVLPPPGSSGRPLEGYGPPRSRSSKRRRRPSRHSAPSLNHGTDVAVHRFRRSR
jgi:hypothetical protein